jgi:hypothetical protein
VGRQLIQNVVTELPSAGMFRLGSSVPYARYINSISRTWQRTKKHSAVVQTMDEALANDGIVFWSAGVWMQDEWCGAAEEYGDIIAGLSVYWTETNVSFLRAEEEPSGAALEGI